MTVGLVEQHKHVRALLCAESGRGLRHQNVEEFCKNPALQLLRPEPLVALPRNVDDDDGAGSIAANRSEEPVDNTWLLLPEAVKPVPVLPARKQLTNGLPSIGEQLALCLLVVEEALNALLKLLS